MWGNEEPVPSSEEVKHGVFNSENIGQLYLSGDHSDLTLIVEGQRFQVHKLILAAQSKFFEAMLFGNFEESTKTEIELKGISAVGFDKILKYIYTGQLLLGSLDNMDLLGILQIAHIYELTRLSSSIIDYLMRHVSVENVCYTLKVANELNLPVLIEVCLVNIDQNAVKILESNEFPQFNSKILQQIISRDSFFATENQILRGVQEWIKFNPTENATDITEHLRLELMMQRELFSDVRRCGLFSSEEIFDAQEKVLEAKYSLMRYRGLVLYDVNVANNAYKPKVTTGCENGSVPRDDFFSGYNFDVTMRFMKKVSRVFDKNGIGITIELGSQYLINYIKIKLSSASSKSYYVEISVDKKIWLRVIDYSDFCCREWQYLYFGPKVVKFIKIVGTASLSVNEDLSISKFEAYYKLDHKKILKEQLIVPDYNVAVAKLGASCKLYGRKSDYLLDDDDVGSNRFTTPGKNSNSIIVELAQPYMLGSLRMLLRELDNHCYSYWIETSGNYKDWEMAVDKRQENCRGWQFLTFDRPRPVVFICITATPESVRQGFGLVRFECPAVVDDKKNKKQRTTY